MSNINKNIFFQPDFASITNNNPKVVVLQYANFNKLNENHNI